MPCTSNRRRPWTRWSGSSAQFARGNGSDVTSNVAHLNALGAGCISNLRGLAVCVTVGPVKC